MYKYIYVFFFLLPFNVFAKTESDRKTNLIAEKLITLFKSNGQAQRELLKRIIPLVKNSPFEKFYPELTLLENLSKSSDDSLLPCKQFVNSKKPDFLADLLEKLIQEKCTQNIFHSSKSYTTRETTEESLLHLSSLIKYIDNNSLVNLVRSHKNSQSYKSISSWIEHLLESNSVNPSEELIKELDLEPAISNSLFKKIDQKMNLSLFKNEIGALSMDLINNKNQEEVQNNTKYFLSYLHQNKDYLSNETISGVLQKTGKFLLINQNTAEAKEIFLFSNLNKGEAKDYTSIFYNILLANLEKDRSQLENIITKHKLVEKFSELPQKLKYWVAFSLENKGNRSVDLYKETITQNPFDFYAIASLDRIKQLQGTEYYISYVKEKYLKRLSQKTNKVHFYEIDNYFKRLESWLSLGSFSFSSKEVQNILTTIEMRIGDNTLPRKDGVALIENLSNVLRNKNGLIHLTSNLNRINTITSGETTLETLKNSFPERYLNALNRYGSKGFSFLALALMRQESAFQERALSSAGAVGLMQIMPKTGSLIQRGMTKNKLFNKDINIKIGTKYLKNLIDFYDGNIIYALAAYNAGMSRVNRWSPTLDQFVVDPVVIMELIPYDETNNYVKYIYRNYFFYNLLYGDINKLPKIASSLLKS